MGDDSVAGLQARDDFGEAGARDTELDRPPLPILPVGCRVEGCGEGPVADPADGLERDAGDMLLALDQELELGRQAGGQGVEAPRFDADRCEEGADVGVETIGERWDGDDLGDRAAQGAAGERFEANPDRLSNLDVRDLRLVDVGPGLDVVRVEEAEDRLRRADWQALADLAALEARTAGLVGVDDDAVARRAWSSLRSSPRCVSAARARGGRTTRVRACRQKSPGFLRCGT